MAQLIDGGGGLRIRFEEYSQAHEMPVQSATREEARQKRAVSFRSTLEETTQHDAQDGRRQARGAAGAAHIPAYDGDLDAVRRSLRASIGIALETIQDKHESKVFVAAVRRGGPAANAVPPLLVRLIVTCVARAMHSLYVVASLVGGNQHTPLHAIRCFAARRGLVVAELYSVAAWPPRGRSALIGRRHTVPVWIELRADAMYRSPRVGGERMDG